MGSFLDQIDTATLVSKIQASYQFTVIVNEDGNIKAWGANADGQLGYGDTDRRGDEGGEMGSYLPFTNLGSGLITYHIYLELESICALVGDSTSIISGLKCWGDSVYGQTGSFFIS